MNPAHPADATAALLQKLKLPPEMAERFKKLTPQQQQKFIVLQQQRYEEAKKQKQQQLLQQQQRQSAGTPPSGAQSPRAVSPAHHSTTTAPAGGGGQRPSGALQQPQQQQPAAMTKEDIAKRLQRLGFLKQQQQQLNDAQQATPAMIPDSVRKASLIQNQRGRGLSVKSSGGGGVSATGGGGGLVPSTGGSQAKSSRDQSPSMEEDLDSDRLFVLSSKHCGAQVITKYNVVLHYFVAGVDVAPPPPPPPPSAPPAPPKAAIQEAALDAGTGRSPTPPSLQASRSHPPTPPGRESPAAAASSRPQAEGGSRGSTPVGASSANAGAQLETPTRSQATAGHSELPPQVPVQSPPPPPSAAAVSRDQAAVKKHRLVFCIAENPNASQRPMEERLAAWRALTNLSKMHMVCSMRAFRATFACFITDDDEAEEPSTMPPQTASERKKIASAVKELTRSAAVPLLNALFPVFDQSSCSLSSPSQERSSAAFRGTRCWDSSGTAWCPVARLGRIMIVDHSAPATASQQQQLVSGGGAAPPPLPADGVARKTVFSLNPLTIALREDIAYVTKLPIMSELQDRFMNRRQTLADEHAVNVSNLQKEIAMLEIELDWAQDQLDQKHIKHQSAMKSLQATLEELHMTLQEATGRRFYIPLDQKRREIQQRSSGALEASPVRQKIPWNSAIVDVEGNVTSAGQLFSRKHQLPWHAHDDRHGGLTSLAPGVTKIAVPEAISQSAVGKVLLGWTKASTYEVRQDAATLHNPTIVEGPERSMIAAAVGEGGLATRQQRGRTIMTGVGVGVRPVNTIGTAASTGAQGAATLHNKSATTTTTIATTTTSGVYQQSPASRVDRTLRF